MAYLKQQMLEKLGFSKQTSKNLSDSIEDFGKDLKNIATKIDLYSKASFNTLITMFEKAGKKIGFSISDFFKEIFSNTLYIFL